MVSPDLLSLALSAKTRAGLDAIPLDSLSDSSLLWFACAELAARWASGHPLHFLQNRQNIAYISLLTPANIGETAFSWCWQLRPGEWDCDGFWCSEARTQEFLTEITAFAANTLL